MGVAAVAAGLFLAPFVTRPWHLYATLGVLVGGGSVCLAYTGQSFFLPNWFVRRRGLALSIAVLRRRRGLDRHAAVDADAASPRPAGARPAGRWLSWSSWCWPR
jgi:hypothetical protein